MSSLHPTPRLRLPVLLAALTFLLAPAVLPIGRAATVVTAWEAFQEHVPSDKTHPHATGYPMRLSAPPQPLKRFADGTLLPVTIEVIATDTPDNFGAQAPPDPGTPADLLFGGILDVGNDGTVGVRSSRNSTVRLIFRGLDPAKRYMFRGTVSRGGSGANLYPERWSLHALEGARGFVHAHVDGSANQNIFTVFTFPDAQLETNQVALNSGYNREGSLVGWDDIIPDEHGSFSVFNAHYTGPAPFGDPAAGPYGYSLVAIYLAEVSQVLPFSITTHPASLTVPPGSPASFSVTVQPADGVSYQWQKALPGSDFVHLEGATAPTLTLPAVSVADDRTRYRVLISDATGTLPSREATLNVIGAPIFIPGWLRFEVFRGITGTSIDNLVNSPRYPGSPDATLHIIGFDTLSLFPGGVENNYGGRITGFVIPPESGEYEFFLRSDNSGQLWISPDDNLDLAQVVADSVCCGPFEEPGMGTATSAPIPLVAGQRYAVMALLKESDGMDYLQVAWRRSGDATPAAELPPLSPAHVGAFIPARGRLEITAQPQPAEGAQNGTATFTLGVTSSETPVLIQWKKNGVFIPGAIGPVLTLGPLTPADDQAKISALVSVPGASLESAEALLSVSTDVTPPGLLAARATESFDAVIVQFTEAVRAASAGNPSNYSLTPSLAISAVTVLSPTQVRLQTAPQQEGVEYTLTVSAVEDSVGNVIPPGSTLRFTSLARLRGGLKFEVYRGISGTPVQNLLDSPRYPDQPDFVGYLGAFDTRTVFRDDANNNYGARISGWIIPPQSGEYEFFVRSDDASQLYLSTDATEAGLQLIAEETGCCGVFEESGAPETSWPIALEAGRRYFIRGLYKEGSGGDYMQVAWRRVGDPAPAVTLTPIPGSFFEVIAPPGTLIPPTVSLTSPAAGSAVPPGAEMVLTATATAAGEKSITGVEFYRNGTRLGSVTAPPYTFTVNSLPEEAYSFNARATDSAGISTLSETIVAAVGPPRTRVVLVAVDEHTTWRYDRSGHDLGTAWREPAFDDSAWPQGRALLGEEPGLTVEPMRTPISRLNDEGEYVKTMYFRTRFPWSGGTEGVRLRLRHVVDDGVVVYLNGTEIHRFGLPAGPVDYWTDAASHENAWEGPFEVPAGLLQEWDNVLAAEVHQNGSNSSDIVFGAELAATRPLAGPAEPAVISIARRPAGFELLWADGGILEVAELITGPWTEVAGAVSPYPISPDGPGRFYRIRR